MSAPPRLAFRVEQIQLEIADLKKRLDGCRMAATYQCIDAGQQFDKGIRLGKIVVAAGLEALHAVVHIRKRAQEQHGRQIAVLAHFLDKLEAVELGKHAVHDRDIVGSRQSERQPDFAVGGVIDHMARFLEPVHEIALRFEIVLYDENAHCQSPAQ